MALTITAILLTLLLSKAYGSYLLNAYHCYYYAQSPIKKNKEIQQHSINEYMRYSRKMYSFNPLLKGYMESCPKK